MSSTAARLDDERTPVDHGTHFSEAEDAGPQLLGAPGAFAALAHRDFRIFIIGATISNAGTWMQNLALGFLMFRLTHSAFWVGLVGFTQLFPLALLGLVSGAVADRFERRHILLWTQGTLMLLAFALAIVSAAGAAHRWAVLGLVLLVGIVAAFNVPAWQTLVPDLVPRERMQNAITLNSAQFNLARVVGPLLAGLIVARYGVTTAFVINGVSYVTVLWALLVVRPLRPQELSIEPALERVRGGIRFAHGHPGVRRALLTVALVSLCGIPVMQLLPVVAGWLHAGAGGLGLLTGCFGAGAVAGALVVHHLEKKLTRAQMITAGYLGFGFGLIGLGFSRWLAVAAIVLVPLGVSFLTTVSLLNTSVQMMTPDSYRGRVMSIYILCFGGLMPVGALGLGRLSDAIGIGHALPIGGIALVAYAVLAGARGRLRALDVEAAPVSVVS